MAMMHTPSLAFHVERRRGAGKSDENGRRKDGSPPPRPCAGTVLDDEWECDFGASPGRFLSGFPAEYHRQRRSCP